MYLTGKDQLWQSIRVEWCVISLSLAGCWEWRPETNSDPTSSKGKIQCSEWACNGYDVYIFYAHSGLRSSDTVWTVPLWALGEGAHYRGLRDLGIPLSLLPSNCEMLASILLLSRDCLFLHRLLTWLLYFDLDAEWTGSLRPVACWCLSVFCVFVWLCVFVYLGCKPMSL